MRKSYKKSEQTYIYRPTPTLSAWIKWVVVGYVLVFATGILVNIFYHLPVITKVRDTAQTAMQDTQNVAQYDAIFTQMLQSFDELEVVSNITIVSSGLVFIVSAILIGVWINRSHKNARALGITDIKASPAWAVGSFFVPIITLFVPYQAMKQLVNRSLETVNQIAPSWILPIWWGTWLLDNIFNRVASRMADKITRIDEQATSLDTIFTQLYTMMNSTITTIWLENLAGILGIISAILLLRIIQMVNRAHQQLYETKDDLNHEPQANQFTFDKQ